MQAPLARLHTTSNRQLRPSGSHAVQCHTSSSIILPQQPAVQQPLPCCRSNLLAPRQPQQQQQLLQHRHQQQQRCCSTSSSAPGDSSSEQAPPLQQPQQQQGAGVGAAAAAAAAASFDPINAAAAAAAPAQAAVDSTTSSSSPQQQPRRRKGAGGAAAGGAPWTYKYRWQPCPTMCAPGDRRCLEVEALIQGVLSYPNAPARIVRLLPSLTADVASMTEFVEAMASHFGKELTLIYIRKMPRILELRFSDVLERIRGLTQLLGVLESDVPLLLRKNPGLLLLEGDELRSRHANIAAVTRFNNQQVRAFILKFPVALALHPDYVAASISRLRALCYTRDEWAHDFEAISPSLLAYFLRDVNDQLSRLEYLAATGERPEWKLREVMKPADRTFRAKLHNYAAWEARLKQRRAAQRAAADGAAQAAVVQAEAAAIKAALLEAEGEQQEQAQAQ